MIEAYIKAISYNLPEKILTNADIARDFPEWTEEKIASKIGILERHITVEGETASDLACGAAEKLFATNNIDRETVDYLIFVTQSPDYHLPTTACTIQTQAEAVRELFKCQYRQYCGKSSTLGEDLGEAEIKIIGIRHGEKMYETLLTKEECAKAEDMGNFYRVPADNRGLNYDKFFKEGDTKRAEIEEFNSDNTYRLNLEETKAKIGALEYIKKELSGEGNFVQ